MTTTGLELRSTVNASGTLTLSLEKVTLAAPTDDEVIVRVEAAPVNPSDLALLLGPADLTTVTGIDTDGRPALSFVVPPERMAAFGARIDQSLPVGNEGAGTVIEAGQSARHLIGRTVSMIGGGMYTQYRKLKARDIIPLPDGVSAAGGASMFVNPMTALSFLEATRLEGHKAIVHTAAASNLGQMLQKLCLADGIELVNIVRSKAQGDILAELGATYALQSNDAHFRTQLDDAIAQTGATIAFDAIGGGSLGSEIIQSMERSAVRTATEYSRYGSNVYKKLYIYGMLDPSPTVLHRGSIGFQWGVHGFLVTPFLQTIAPERVAAMRHRIIDELTTTFASHYTATIGLAEALDPTILRAYERKTTGEKYLIDPTKDLADGRDA